MSSQSVRITNYGTNTENLNLTNALHAVGINVDTAEPGDIIYIVFDKNGKKLCSARGVLKEKLELTSFGWPEDHDFVSIWQIDGQLQFCEPFDLRALKSSRDASQYLWYVDRAEAIENDRINTLLHQLFNEHATTDGSFVIHEKLQQHSDQASGPISARTVLQSSPIVQHAIELWNSFKKFLIGEADFADSETNISKAQEEASLQEAEPPIDDSVTDTPALQTAAAEERICESGFGVVVSEDDEDHFDIREFASELNAEFSAEMNQSVRDQLQKTASADVRPEDLSLDLPVPEPAQASSATETLQPMTSPAPPEVLAALEEVALDLGIAVELAEPTTGKTVAVVEPTTEKSTESSNPTLSDSPELVAVQTPTPTPEPTSTSSESITPIQETTSSDNGDFMAFDEEPTEADSTKEEAGSIISVDDFLK